MSGPVDVLAYLRREVEKGKYARPHIVAKRKAVLDAVAELIDAAKEMRANFRCVLDVNCNCDEEFIARQTANVDAALARVQGGAE